MSEYARSVYGFVFWGSWVGVGGESAEKFRAALAGGCWFRKALSDKLGFWVNFVGLESD